MDTFAWKPAPGASLALKPTVEVAKFGEGYEQRVGIGINSQMDKWSLKFTTNVLDIHSFLKSKNGEFAFLWTNPVGVTSSYVCREWKLSHIAGSIFDLSADFEQVPA